MFTTGTIDFSHASDAGALEGILVVTVTRLLLETWCTSTTLCDVVPLLSALLISSKSSSLLFREYRSTLLGFCGPCMSIFLCLRSHFPLTQLPLSRKNNGLYNGVKALTRWTNWTSNYQPCSFQLFVREKTICSSSWTSICMALETGLDYQQYTLNTIPKLQQDIPKDTRNFHTLEHSCNLQTLFAEVKL